MGTFNSLQRVEDFSEAIKSTQTYDELFGLLTPCIEDLGFERYAYWLVWPSQGPNATFFRNTYPKDWVDYYADMKYGADDLILRYATTQARPYEWADVYKNYLPTPDQKIVINEGAEAGIRAGATVPLFGPGDTRAIFSVTNNQSEESFSKIFKQSRHALHLIATFAHERILQLNLEHKNIEKAHLSARELEVLTWISRGKTIGETGTILGLSSNTVKDYLQQACTRLGAINKTHAAVIATRHKLILPI